MQQDFLKYQAQTTPHPLALEVSKASGSYIYDLEGNAHLDFVAGVSACSLGHCHPKIVKAIKEQSQSYMHVMGLWRIRATTCSGIFQKFGCKVTRPIGNGLFGQFRYGGYGRCHEIGKKGYWPFTNNCCAQSVSW